MNPPSVVLAPEQLDALVERVAAQVAAVSQPRVVSADVIAAQLDVPKSWVLAEARADRIPHVRLGRYVRFEPEVVAAWWRERAAGPRVRTGSHPVSAGGERP